MPFIMLTVLIDMMAIGLIIPVLPALVGSFTGSQADQAFWYGVVTFAFSIANFFGSPVLGALSDSHGRRPVLLIGFCGLALSFFATASRHRAVDADRRAPGQRRDAVQPGGRQRLRRRHHRARGAREALRHARRDVRAGLHRRAGDGRPARARSTCACRSSPPAGWRCSICCTAIFVLPESLPVAAPARVRLEDGQPGRLAARAGAAEGRGAAGRGGRLQRARAVRALHLLGAVHDASSSAGGRGRTAGRSRRSASCR